MGLKLLKKNAVNYTMAVWFGIRIMGIA